MGAVGVKSPLGVLAAGSLRRRRRCQGSVVNPGRRSMTLPLRNHAHSGTAPEVSASLHVPITVVIPTLNEIERIAAGLPELEWADEIIVADGGSTDGTREMAARLGAKVIVVAGRTIAAQRNAAIALARNEWVLALDADEQVTPDLRDELARLCRSGAPTPDRLSRAVAELAPRRRAAPRAVGSRLEGARLHPRSPVQRAAGARAHRGDRRARHADRHAHPSSVPRPAAPGDEDRDLRAVGDGGSRGSQATRRTLGPSRSAVMALRARLFHARRLEGWNQRLHRLRGERFLGVPQVCVVVDASRSRIVARSAPELIRQ